MAHNCHLCNQPYNYLTGCNCDMVELERLKKDAARYRFLRDWKGCNLHLEVNAHKACYETVEEWLKGHHEGDPEREFLSIIPGEREKMVAAQVMYEIQCYQNTPVGFYTIGAASLDALVDHWMET